MGQFFISTNYPQYHVHTFDFVVQIDRKVWKYKMLNNESIYKHAVFIMCNNGIFLLFF